jgi:glyoxylase-like metal-dependent hydrolase (beta-lactamase superfamily II)
VLPDGQERDVMLNKPLLVQLADSGYPPEKVTYLALSHYHFDHTANANEFSAATWLVRKSERDAMFAAKPPPVTVPSSYARLMTTKTLTIAGDYDVFGDGSVIIKPAPGHSPGHQVLYLKLARTGPIVLSGDLYHFPESRTLQRIPTFEFDPEQSRMSRAAIEEFLRSAGARLWIQHDFVGNAKLRKAPEYYD